MSYSGIFAILLSQDGFQSNYPETKFQTITFYSQFRRSHNQISFNIGVLKDFATRKHMCCRILLTSKKDSSTGVFLWILWNFYEKLFYRTSVAPFLSLIENCSVLGICRPYLLNKKHNVGWFCKSGQSMSFTYYS